MSENPAEYLNNDDEQPVKPEELDTTAANLEKELAETKQKAEEYLANWQRSQADFSNYRRRNEQEKLDLGKYANATLFCEILPVLDDLELALGHIPENHAKSDWVEGVRLVERKFKSILEKQGVKPVCALGMSFDPNLHEAIKQEKGKEGAVIAEVQKGYTLGERLLRPSRVIVGSGETEKKAKAPKKEAASDDASADTPEK
jgi:molecular chaperone GrpE